MVNGHIHYLKYTLLNDQAAYSVWQEALETRDQLSKIARNLTPCSHPQLKKNGYRTINFQWHHYFIIYRLEGQTAYVDAIHY